MVIVGDIEPIARMILIQMPNMHIEVMDSFESQVRILLGHGIFSLGRYSSGSAAIVHTATLHVTIQSHNRQHDS